MRFPAVLRVILPFPSLPPQMEQLSYFVASRKSTLSNILLPNLRCFFLRLLLLSLESASINEDKYKVFSQDIEFNIYILNCTIVGNRAISNSISVQIQVIQVSRKDEEFCSAKLAPCKPVSCFEIELIF